MKQVKFRLEIYGEDSNVALVNDTLEGFVILKPLYCDMVVALDTQKKRLYEKIKNTRFGVGNSGYSYLEAYKDDEIVLSIYKDSNKTVSTFYNRCQTRLKNLYELNILGLLKYLEDMCEMKVYRGNSTDGYTEFPIGIEKLISTSGKVFFRVYSPGWRSNYLLDKDLVRVAGSGGKQYRDTPYDNKILNMRFNDVLQRILNIEVMHNLQKRVYSFSFKKGKSLYLDLYDGIREFTSASKSWQNMVFGSETFVKYARVGDNWYNCYTFTEDGNSSPDAKRINDRMF